MTGRGPLDTLVRIGSGLAVALTAHTLVNSRALLRVRPETGPAIAEPVSVLVPARDEEATLPALLADLMAQQELPDLEILVLDDRSADATAAVIDKAAGADPRIRRLDGADPPPGWLGKPHACSALSAAARGTVLVFVDADVRLHPTAVAATVRMMRARGMSILSPYPRQEAVTAAERLVQPLLQWSWLTTLPLAWATRSRRPSLSAANGQFVTVDAAVYRAAGGHGAVRDRVLEDIGLMRAVKAAGGRGVPADGSLVASCRMYSSWSQVRDGYTKSLWEAFGSPGGAAAVMAFLVLAYVLPPAAALTGSRTGAIGYAAAVVGRWVAGRASGARLWPDSLAHPVSIGIAAWLTALSWHRRRSGTLTWKGRRLP